MIKRINRQKRFVLAAAVMIVILSACGSDNVEESISETTKEFLETISVAESAEDTTEKIRDNVIMYYDLEEIVLESEKIDIADDTDYDLNKLIPVHIYEQTGAKLYAYAYEYEVGDGFQHTDYKFLLEYDGIFQAFNYGIGGIFQYESQEALYTREFEQGREYDFDDDGRLEFVEFVSYIYGTSASDAKIIVFDFNEDSGEYEAYCIGAKYFDDLVNKCMKVFFDEYYCPYTIDEYGRYSFENSVSVICGFDVSAYVNDEDIMEISSAVYGGIRDEDNFGYEVGSIIFEVNYIGNGRFSVKASRYKEIKNIMNPNVW